MIQRIQSVYLLLVVLLSVVLLFVPVYSFRTMELGNAISHKVFIGSNNVHLLFNLLTGLFTLIIIFLFKKRTLQIKMCNLNMLFICVFIGTIFYVTNNPKENIDSFIHYEFGCYLPLIQLVFTFLAMRAIRKDEQLVRS